jgi:hypothetical protein
MNIKQFPYSLLLALAVAAPGAMAQGFDSGSTGADGELRPTASTTIPLPPSGVLHYTKITIPTGVILTFTPNALNTPVHLLSQGDVTIAGSIDVSGGVGDAVRGGQAGPGGFAGGKPGISGLPPGGGYGPGAGKGGTQTSTASGAGGGAYSTVPTAGSSTNVGTPYGSPLLVPLLGGSGGGGSPVVGGGGGGGAIVVASNTRIDLTGVIRANGGASGYGYGSGGGIRLVAPIVTGRGSLSAAGGVYGGQGRIRVDTVNRREFNLAANPDLSLGSFMTVFPPLRPRLDVIEAAGTAIPEGTGSLITIQLPFGSDPNRIVKVQARDFGSIVPIEVALIPDSGTPLIYSATIDNSTVNPAQVSVPVVVPNNTVVTVQAWAR